MHDSNSNNNLIGAFSADWKPFPIEENKGKGEQTNSLFMLSNNCILLPNYFVRVKAQCVTNMA